MGHRPPVKGGYFPVPPVDSLQDIRSAMCLALEEQGVEVEVHHHEVAAPGQCEIGTKFDTLVKRADWLQILKYTRAERRARVRQDRDLHAEAHRRRQRLGHARAPVGLEGRQEPLRRRRLRGPVRLRAVLHRRHHQAREGAERDHQSGHQLVQAPGAGLRGADQPRVLGAQPLGVVPHPVRVEPEGPPHRSALPRSDGESVPRVRGDADGGPRRRAEQDPSRRSDRQEPLRPASRKKPRRCRTRARRSTRRSRTSTRTASSSRAAACSPTT